MSLTPEDIDFIKTHLVEWLAEISLGKPPMVYEIELRERLVRVEEELKHQRELIQQILVQMDKRFEQMDKRIGQVDRRLDQIDQRFEQIEKHFAQVDKRFDQVDKHFEQMDQRFEQVDKRFGQEEKQFGRLDAQFLQLTQRIDRFMIWSFATTVSVGGLVVALIKYL